MRATWPDWLIDLMADLKVNNKGLAKLVKVHQSTIGHWLDGTFLPQDPEHIASLARLGRESPVRLFAIINGFQEPKDPVQESARAELYRDIFRILEGANLTGVRFLRDQGKMQVTRYFPRDVEEGEPEGQDGSNGGKTAER